jgi:hypothetical protein
LIGPILGYDTEVNAPVNGWATQQPIYSQCYLGGLRLAQKAPLGSICQRIVSWEAPTLPLDNQILNAWLNEARVPGYNGIYVVGIAAQRITLYSQQVRALRLVHALSELGQLTDDVRQIAVVGGGAAGCTAACALASLGKSVELFEQYDHLISRNTGDRPLDPHLFDWPKPDTLRRDAGLPILDWHSDQANEVKDNLAAKTRTFADRFLGFNLRTNTLVESISPENGGWKLTTRACDQGLPDQRRDSEESYFDMIVISSGFGNERKISGATPLAYWSDNRPESERGKRVFISGNGDGGMIDLVLTGAAERDQVALMREFLERLKSKHDKPGKHLLLDAIQAVEEMHMGGENDAQVIFDQHLKQLMSQRGSLKYVENKVQAATNSIVFNVSSGPTIDMRKGALLSRLMAYASLNALSDKDPGRIEITNGRVCCFSSDEERVRFVDHDPSENVSQCVSRHGPEQSAAVEWFKDIFDAYKAHWDTWKTNNKAHLIPRLHPETYDFFHSRVVGVPQLREQGDQAPCRTATVLVDKISGLVLWRGQVKPREFISAALEAHDTSTLVVGIPFSNCPDAWKGLIYRVANSGNDLINISIRAVDDDWRLACGAIATHGCDAFSKYMSEEVDEDLINGHVAGGTHRLDASFITELFAAFDRLVDQPDRTLQTPGGDVTFPADVWDYVEGQINAWRQQLADNNNYDLRRSFLSLMDGKFADQKHNGPALQSDLIQAALTTIIFAIAACKDVGTLLPEKGDSVNALQRTEAGGVLEWFLCHTDRVNSTAVPEWSGQVPETSAIVIVAPMAQGIGVPDLGIAQTEFDQPDLNVSEDRFPVPLAGNEVNWQAFTDGTLSTTLNSLLKNRAAHIENLRAEMT